MRRVEATELSIQADAQIRPSPRAVEALARLLRSTDVNAKNLAGKYLPQGEYSTGAVPECEGRES